MCGLKRNNDGCVGKSAVIFWKKVDTIIIYTISFCEKIFKKEIGESTKNTVLQLVKFGIIGCSNTALSYIINVIILLLLSHANFKWDYFVGNIVAFVLSVLWSFWWNYHYVFGYHEQQSWWKMLLKTYASYAFTGLLLSNVISFVLIDQIGISKYIAPLIILIISVPINFILNKLWAFK